MIKLKFLKDLQKLDQPRKKFACIQLKLGLILFAIIWNRIELSNKFAPEHLEIITTDPEEF